MSEAGPLDGGVVQQVPEGADGDAGQPQPGRLEERFPTTGSGEIIVNGGKSLFRGRVLNISNSGCFFHIPASVSLSPGMPVEILAIIKGRVLRLSAEARFSKAKGGIGFHFTGMSDVMRARLDELIKSLQDQTEEVIEQEAPRRVWRDAF